MPSVTGPVPGPQRSDLKRELVFRFALLAAVALSLAVLSVIVSVELALQHAWALLLLRHSWALLLVLTVLDAALVVLFGRYLIERYVLRPMDALTRATVELSSGNLLHRAPAAETREFTDLADQFNRMTGRLQEMQSQLVRAEKLASIGRLAAGIAHEVGNPLSAVNTYLEVLRKRGADPEILSALVRETERIDRIVRGLLAYARPRDEQAQEIDVNAVLGSALDILTQQGVLKDVVVHLAAADATVPRIRAKFHDLEQVIVNLLLNAVDAAPGGTITAGAQAWRFQPRSPARSRSSDARPYSREPRTETPGPFRPDLSPGTPGALLFVADSGPGVPAADRERVFDPFYTTKSPGFGTGLGLAIVQRTVDELGGVIWVDEAREGGAAFKVFLPS